MDELRLDECAEGSWAALPPHGYFHDVGKHTSDGGVWVQKVCAHPVWVIREGSTMVQHIAGPLGKED